jgi:hypothetical protein
VRRIDGYLQWIAMISVLAFFYCCQHTLFYCLQLLYASSSTFQQWLLTMLSTHRRHLCSKIWDAPTMICWSFCRNFPELRRDKFHRLYQWKKQSAWGVATQSCFDISSLTSVFRVFASKQPALSSATRNLTYWLRRKKRIAPRGTPVTEQHPPNRVRAERAMCFLSFATRLQNARWIGNKFEIYTPAGSNSAAHTPYQPNFYLCATKSWHCAPINKRKTFLGSFLCLTSRQTWPI